MKFLACVLRLALISMLQTKEEAHASAENEGRNEM